MKRIVARLAAFIPIAVLLSIAFFAATALAAPIHPGAISANAPTILDRDGWPAPIVVPVERGTTFDQVLANLGYEGNRVYDAYDLDPGVPVEGDGLARTIFTRDGSRVLVTNLMTNNVTVFDWPSMNVIANVAVGNLPYGIAVTNDFAVVACPHSDAAYVIRLSDYTVAGIIPTGQRPWIVRTSPDGRYAYVSTEIGGTCEKIDLATMTKTLVIHDFPMRMLSYTYNSENARYWPNFLAFEVTPDGSHVFTGDWNDSVLFYDTTTGALDHTLTGMPNCVSVALSGDGTRAIAMSIGTFLLHQIDLASYTRTDTVAPSGLTWGTTYEMGVNQDGSKVYVSVGDNQSAIIRFLTHDYVTFSQTLSAFWVGTSPDHVYAVSGQNYFSIVSLVTDSVVGQSPGNPQLSGAVSPVGNRVAAFDPNRDESVFFYDFTTPAAPVYRGKTMSGEAPEGDAPRRVTITPDGSKAILSDVLSANLTILDLATNSVEALVPIGEHPRDIAITSDSRWAAVPSFSPGKLSILDLTTDQVVANVRCGDGPAVVRIAPNDQTAYVADLAQNKVFVVHLAGAASQVVAEIPVGEIGSLLVGGSVESDIEVSPDGNEVLVAASFDNKVRVIDTATNRVVTEIWTGTFPLRIAFDETGDYAIVTNYLGNCVTIMRIDGANSTRIDTRGRGEGPLRIDSNPVLHQIGVGNLWSNNVVDLDPATGDLLQTDDFSAWGHVLQVIFDERGAPIVLAIPDTGSPHLLRGADAVSIPAPATFFDYCPATRTAVVTCPGPDYAVVVHWSTAGTPEVVTVPLSSAGTIETPRPNPVTTGEGRLGFSIRRDGEVEIALVDPTGRTVADVARGRYAAGPHAAGFSTQGLASGTYFAFLKLDGRIIATRKLTVLDATP